MNNQFISKCLILIALIPLIGAGGLGVWGWIRAGKASELQQRREEMAQQVAEAQAREKALFVATGDISQEKVDALKEKVSELEKIRANQARDIDSQLERVENTKSEHRENIQRLRQEVAELIETHKDAVNKVDADEVTLFMRYLHQFQGDVRNNDGNVFIIQEFLRHGADLHARDSMGRTPLNWAILNERYGTASIYELLIERGADVNAVDARDETVLHSASMKGNVDAVKVLLKHHADVTRVADDHITCLMLAALNNHEEVCRALIEAGCDINSKIRGSGSTALAIAVEKGHINICRLLVEHGADCNVRSADGVSLIAMATMNGHTELCAFLLDRGLDVNDRSIRGCPLIEIAAVHGYTEICDLLLKRGANQAGALVDAFVGAAGAGQAEICRLLLRAGVSVDVRVGPTNMTPLMSYAGRGNVKACELLLDLGADIDAKDSGMGATPLMYGVAGGHEDVIRLLLARGANTQEKDRSGAMAQNYTPSAAIKRLLKNPLLAHDAKSETPEFAPVDMSGRTMVFSSEKGEAALMRIKFHSANMGRLMQNGAPGRYVTYERLNPTSARVLLGSKQSYRLIFTSEVSGVAVSKRRKMNFTIE